MCGGAVAEWRGERVTVLRTCNVLHLLWGGRVAGVLENWGGVAFL